jgi:hypothetical protein
MLESDRKPEISKSKLIRWVEHVLAQKKQEMQQKVGSEVSK